MTQDIVVTRTIHAAPDRVFAAWTTPRLFAEWFGTRATAVPLDSVVLDVRVGGSWTARMQLPEGRTVDWLGEYTEVDPPRRLALTMSDDPEGNPGEPIVVTFQEVDGGTEMTLIQPNGGFDDDQVAATEAGYGAFFDDLAAVVERDARGSSSAGG